MPPRWPRQVSDQHLNKRANTGPAHLVKHVLQLVLRQRTALDVLDRSQVLGHPLAVLLCDGAHLLLGEFFPHAAVVSQIGLGAHDEAGDARAVVVNLGEPLLADVLE